MSNGVNNEISWIDKLLRTNLNYTGNKSSSNHCNISNTMSKKIAVTEDRQFNYSNPTRSKSKYYINNSVDNNRNVSNGLGNKDLYLENFENSE